MNTDKKSSAETAQSVVHAMPLMLIIAYEIQCSWWVAYIRWDWAQELAARYFAWKATRIQKRFRRALAIKVLIDVQRAQKSGFAEGGYA